MMLSRFRPDPLLPPSLFFLEDIYPLPHPPNPHLSSSSETVRAGRQRYRHHAVRVVE